MHDEQVDGDECTPEPTSVHLELRQCLGSIFAAGTAIPDVVERIEALVVNSGGRAVPAVELALAVGDLLRLVELVGLGASAMRDTLVEDSHLRNAA